MMTIDQLEQRIHERKITEGRVERIEMGEGITIDREGGLLFVTSADGDRALAGYMDRKREKYTLYHDWFVVLEETFGKLPSRFAEDGEYDE